MSKGGLRAAFLTFGGNAMQFASSVYGAFDINCPQVYAYDQNTSLVTETALAAVPKALFTLGIAGQANPVRGVRDGKRYLAHLKWAYSALPASDDQLHVGPTGVLCSGCSNSQDDYVWDGITTLFMNTEPDVAQYFYGKCIADTGIGSSGLDISATLRVNNNANIRYTGTLYGRYHTEGYVPITDPITFNYAWIGSTSVNGHSYGTRKSNGDELALYATTTVSDDVLVLDKYECVKGDLLFRFTPQDIDFGFGVNPVPGTRPKVVSVFTHVQNL